jgi:hypothetical protein
MADYLIINTASAEVYEVNDLANAARIIDCPESDIHWGIKRTGRYDGNHCIVIPKEVEDN